jgi:hypothetical protein
VAIKWLDSNINTAAIFSEVLFKGAPVDNNI